eukprot:2130644-Amphidinium_carterae.2
MSKRVWSLSLRFAFVCSAALVAQRKKPRSLNDKVSSYRNWIRLRPQALIPEAACHNFATRHQQNCGCSNLS